MDRTREEIRDEVFGLDPAVQAHLAEDIIEHLSQSEESQAWIREVQVRREAYLAGVLKTTSPRETFAKTQALIADKKSKSK